MDKDILRAFRVMFLGTSPLLYTSLQCIFAAFVYAVHKDGTHCLSVPLIIIHSCLSHGFQQDIFWVLFLALQAYCRQQYTRYISDHVLGLSFFQFIMVSTVVVDIPRDYG